MGMMFKYTPDDLDRVFNTPADENPDIPNTIRLRDGREFIVRDLYAQISKSEMLNRLRLLKIRLPAAVRKPKSRSAHYTPEERIWIIQHSVDEIVNRFNLTKMQANAAKSQQEYHFRKKHGIAMLAQLKGLAQHYQSP